MNDTDILEILCAYGTPQDEEKFEQALEKAIEIVKESMWVPVEERLPEKSGEYLTTLKYVGIETETVYISVEETFYEIGKGFQVGRNESVIAWKPLGEPYEAGGEKE